MKILYRTLILLLLLLAILVAVSNASVVALTMWPLPFTIAAPLYLLILTVLLLGMLAGLALGWWGARHHRRGSRERAKEVARLDREVARLRDLLAIHHKPPAANETQVPAQKSIERQSALVAPGLMTPRRGSPSP